LGVFFLREKPLFTGIFAVLGHKQATAVEFFTAVVVDFVHGISNVGIV